METGKDKSMINPKQMSVGVVGLGFMGCSITTCLLMAGHPVVGIAPTPVDLKTAEEHIREHLAQSLEKGICREEPTYYLKNLIITEDYNLLKDTQLVIETVIENVMIKKQVYKNIESAVTDYTIITSNTSAIPISVLQEELRQPKRFFGLHWSVPAHTTRSVEIICGDASDQEQAEWLYELAHHWGKEAMLLRKDIRGFIRNRLMYALYREAFYLVENGYASIEDVDRACRYGPGNWISFVGCFRWMDLAGVPAFHAVMTDLFPTLHNGTEVPKLIDNIVKSGGNGISNGNGFYQYTPEEAHLWQETLKKFSYDIRQLVQKYPDDLVKKELELQEKDESNAGTVSLQPE
jgi:3-hydroxybutyryl-CoA dehydrogenase